MFSMSWDEIKSLEYNECNHCTQKVGDHANLAQTDEGDYICPHCGWRLWGWAEFDGVKR